VTPEPRVETLPIGAFRVHLVEEATLERPAAQFFRGASQADLAASGLADANVTLSFQPAIVETPAGLVLLDAGVGAGIGEGDTPLVRALRRLGRDPADVTDVVLSHCHTDHAAGLLDGDGRPLFSGATLHLFQAEWEHWQAVDAFGEESPHAVEFRRAVLAHPGPTARHADEVEVAPGISLIPAPGHTPGHAAVGLRSGGQALVWAADAFHHPLHLRRHAWHYENDHDPAQTASTRATLLGRARADGARLCAYHFPFPGVVDPPA